MASTGQPKSAAAVYLGVMCEKNGKIVIIVNGDLYMKKIILSLLIILSLNATHSFAATARLNGSKLLGFDDVDVDGTIYNVTFADGAFSEVFTEPLVFSSYDEAYSASRALNAAFVETGENSRSHFPTGIEADNTGSWLFHTPYNSSATSYINSLYLQMNTTGYYYIGIWGIFPDFTTEASETITMAVWSPAVTAVPLPAAVLLFGSGFIGLVGFARCKETLKVKSELFS